MLKGDGSRLRQVVTNIVGNIHRYTPATPGGDIRRRHARVDQPRIVGCMSANDASMRYFIEAVDVSRSMQMGMNYAVVFSDHGRACRELPLKIFERFYTGTRQARLKGGTGRHGHRAVGGQGAQGLHLRDRLPGRRPHAHGGAARSAAGAEIAVDEPPQDAKAERRPNATKPSREKQQARQHKSK